MEVRISVIHVSSVMTLLRLLKDLQFDEID